MKFKQSWTVKFPTFLSSQNVKILHTTLIPRQKKLSSPFLPILIGVLASLFVPIALLSELED